MPLVPSSLNHMILWQTPSFTAGFSDLNQTMRDDLKQMFINPFIPKRNNSRSTLSVHYSQINPQPTYKVIWLQEEVALENYGNWGSSWPKVSPLSLPCRKSQYILSPTLIPKKNHYCLDYFRAELWFLGSDCQLGRTLPNQTSGEWTFAKKTCTGIGHGCAWKQDWEPVNIPKTPFKVI